ncbi:uncharacterized protein LOC126268171 [Schistocerca gregaria]|uniref:uncharacterized protein LOC126268171 n=1 Tax=Schistocerca gregaria TaxID=7010 RepID=UPI00211EA7C4|nr:uncharacterized protein LOC126268171 [Schistocerca gregaria]
MKMKRALSRQGFFATCIIAAVILKPASAIWCYQCRSTDHKDPFQCGEYMTSDISIEPLDCKAVYNAQYCVKQTGRFEVQAISCYQCSSTENIECADNVIHESSLSPHSCDGIFEAMCCIKTTGFFEGGLGTKRFCSSHDLGNYCNYIQQPGDELEYRSCVYTCSTDGCNAANVQQPTVHMFLCSLLFAGFYFSFY